MRRPEGGAFFIPKDLYTARMRTEPQKSEKIRTKNIKQVVSFSVSPHEVYEMLMDSKRHAGFSGDSAKISRNIGGKISAYGGWVEGKNIKLVADKLIEQSWRGADWPKGHFSTATFRIAKTKTGSTLTFTQVGVPSDVYSDIAKGWKTEYWEKMKRFAAGK
jgi:activator of HSP90 ATPase